jgi:hypothetical protein
MHRSPRACPRSRKDPKGLVYNFVQLLVLLPGVVAPNGEDTFQFGIEQIFAQDTLANHTRRAEKNHLHVVAALSTSPCIAEIEDGVPGTSQLIGKSLLNLTVDCL